MVVDLLLLSLISMMEWERNMAKKEGKEKEGNKNKNNADMQENSRVKDYKLLALLD